jgi:anaerobic ribonucleoside-triphosphate reductase activating protein
LISDQQVRVARVVPRTIAEGPGTRFAIWVQGCEIRCDGCFNPHLWAPRGGVLTPPGSLAAAAREHRVEGITLLGGEPFEQAAALAELARLVQEADLSVMVFTGYYLEELEAQIGLNPSVKDLLDATDLLVDGPYLAAQPELARPWVGSTNQRFHFLTDRYQHLRDGLSALPDRLEVRIRADGTVSVNGWASVDDLDRLLSTDFTTTVKRGRVK